MEQPQPKEKENNLSVSKDEYSNTFDEDISKSRMWI